jgi:hypothetical protein
VYVQVSFNAPEHVVRRPYGKEDLQHGDFGFHLCSEQNQVAF